MPLKALLRIVEIRPNTPNFQTVHQRDQSVPPSKRDVLWSQDTFARPAAPTDVHTPGSLPVVNNRQRERRSGRGSVELDVGDGRDDLFGNVLADLDVALELFGHGAQQGGGAGLVAKRLLADFAAHFKEFSPHTNFEMAAASLLGVVRHMEEIFAAVQSGSQEGTRMNADHADEKQD